MQVFSCKDGWIMKNDHKFDINSFISPDISCAPVYIWVWNDTCTREIIDAGLSEMQRLGIRAFYILPEPQNFRPDSMPTNLKPDYLTPEYFELCAYAVHKGKELGMNCWIYDEGGWPSGGACGRVLKDHPEYARQVLNVYEHCFYEGDTYKKTSLDVVAAFLQDKEMISEGYVFTKDSAVTEYIAEKVICGNADYPDLLNKEATEYFIAITHEKYASVMENALGENVTAVFTDEPKAPHRPFNKELKEQYEAMYGESVLPYLPLIAGRVAVTEENVNILHRWYELCSRMFCNNFLLPCKNWANAHGMAFTGHIDKDHAPEGCVRGGGNFNLMRALRCFDIPGIDVIWRQIYPENKTTIKNDMIAYNGFFPRYASSAARQNGTGLAMSEIFGVAGPGLTFDIMRYTVGYQAVRGINVFNLFNFPLGRKGAHLAQELPIFTESQIYYRELAQFNRYMERLSYIASLGERVCDTGLYYPVYDFQGGLKTECIAKEFDTLGKAMEDIPVDFDIVDDDVIQSAGCTADGYMCLGFGKYKHIIIPENAFVPDDTKKALERFSELGGKVSYGISALTPVINIEGTGLRAMHRKTANGELFCLFRESGKVGDYLIHLPSDRGYLLDPENGTIQLIEAQNGAFSLSLAIGETAVIYLTDEEIKAEKKKDFGDKFEISDEFQFCRELELTFGENGFENIKHSDESVPVKLGDWSYYIGSAYSGSCAYEAKFTLPKEKTGKEGEINLGDVHFSAGVILNGKSLGAALMPPYKVKIPEGVLQENNTLKITVTNTPANRYVHTDYFDKWTVKELSQYFEAEKTFAKDFVSGGLYGPVTVYTE